MNSSQLHQEVQRLTGLWYRCLVDHHKDRDCHFEVMETWSYGDAPTYQVHHYGYIGEEWHSPSFQNRTSAYKWLVKKLTEMIETEASRWLENTDDGDYRQTFREILAQLGQREKERGE